MTCVESSGYRLLWNPPGRPLYVLQDVDGRLFGVGEDGAASRFAGDAAELQEIRPPSTPAFPTEFFGEVVGVAEIAGRAHVQPSTVQKWRQRHNDFPPPFAELAAGPVWLWEPIARWLRVQPPPGRPPTSVEVRIPVAHSSVIKPLRATGGQTYRLRDRFERGSVAASVAGHPVMVEEGDDGRTLTLPEPPPPGQTIELRYRSRLG